MHRIYHVRLYRITGDFQHVHQSDRTEFYDNYTLSYVTSFSARRDWPDRLVQSNVTSPDRLGFADVISLVAFCQAVLLTRRKVCRVCAGALLKDAKMILLPTKLEEKERKK